MGNFVPVVVKIESMQESPDEAYQNVDPWALLETLIQKSEGVGWVGPGISSFKNHLKIFSFRCSWTPLHKTDLEWNLCVE